MIELVSTPKMLKVRNAMGYPYEHPAEKTKSFFKRHNIKLSKYWTDDHDSHTWRLEFATDKDEFLFRLTYSHLL